MAKMLEGLPIVFTCEMNKKLLKPFTILDSSKLSRVWLDKAKGHDGIPIVFFSF